MGNNRTTEARRVTLASLALTVAAVLWILTLAVCIARGAEPPPARPYSCRLLDDEQRKCAFDPHCDKRVVERLTKECWRDGGRP